MWVHLLLNSWLNLQSLRMLNSQNCFITAIQFTQTSIDGITSIHQVLFKYSNLLMMETGIYTLFKTKNGFWIYVTMLHVTNMFFMSQLLESLHCCWSFKSEVYPTLASKGKIYKVSIGFGMCKLILVLWYKGILFFAWK